MLSAELDELLFIILLAAKEAQIYDDFFEVLGWVLGRDSLAAGWACILLGEIFKENVVVVLQDVEVEDRFRDRGL